MKQHHLPRAFEPAGDQRRAVGQRGDHALGKLRVGLSHHLGRDTHVLGDGQAEKRRVLGKGAQRLGLAPAHGAAHRAPAGTQAHRHQRVFLIARHIAGRQARAGETHQQPPLAHPFQQRRGLGVGQPRHIGEDDRIGAGQHDIGDISLDQIGGRGQGLAQVVERREQLQPLALASPGDQRHLAALERIIRQAHRPGRTLAGDLEAAHPVAQLRRQRKLGGGFLRAGAEGQQAAGQLPLGAGGVGTDGAQLIGHLALCARAQRRHLDPIAGKFRPAQGEHRPGAFEHRHRAARLERGQNRLAARARQPVRKPERIERPGLQRGGPFLERRGLRLPRAGDDPGQARAPRARGLEWQIPRRQVAEKHQRHRPGGAFGLVERHGHPFHPPRPVARIGPGAVKHDQQRAASRAALLRIQYRAGKTDDRRCQRQHPQQQQPPRRALGLAFVIAQPRKQRHAGKQPAHRGRRHCAQQDPQNRQGRQPQQQPGRGKTDTEEGCHQARRSNAP